MEKWVEDFARCEELLEEVLEKVILVIRNKNTVLEKGSPLVQKQVEKREDLGKFKTLMKGGGRKKEKRKRLKGAGNKIKKEWGAGECGTKEKARKCPKSIKNPQDEKTRNNL